NGAIGKWIFSPTNFEVEMWPGRFTRGTNIADQLSAFNILTDRYYVSAHVRIESLRAIVMRDNHIVTIAAIPCAVIARNDDRACRRCINRSPACDTKINRIPTVNTLGQNCARYWVSKIAIDLGATSTLVGIASRLYNARRYHYREFAARDDKDRADRECIGSSQIIKFCDFCYVGVVFFCNRSD